MTDQLAPQGGTAVSASGSNPTGSAGASGVPAAEIEKIKAEITSAVSAQMDERVKGFQRLVAGRDETIKALSTQLDEFKTAGLSPEEQVQLREQRLREQNADLQRQLELERLGQEYGDELPHFRQILEAPTAKDQLEMIRALRKTQAAAPQAPAPAPVVPDVDPNNPSRQAPSGVVLADGTVMSDEIADQLLRSVHRQADVTQRNRG